MKKEHFAWGALLSLFAFHLINNMVIVFRDTTPCVADAADYYKMSFFYWKTWMESAKSGDFSLLHHVLDKGLGGQLPAFLTIPFFSIFGVSHDIAVLASQSFFLILIFSMFGLGNSLFDRKTGLLAAFLITFYPGAVGFSRLYMLELPILAVSTGCVYLLIKSDGFKSFKYSLGFGFALSLGELIRPRFFIFIMIPVLFYVIKNTAALFKRTEAAAQVSVIKMMASVLASVALAGFILFPWFPMSSFLSYLKTQELMFSWPALSNVGLTLPYYLRVFCEMHLGWFFVFLFILGLAISSLEKNKRPKIYFLLMWFISTFILVSMFGLKGYPRIMIPLLAPVALISSAGMERLSRFKTGRYLLIALLTFAVFQYFFISYVHKSVNEANPGEYFQDMRDQGLLYPRSRSYDWDRDELLRTFKESRHSDGAWGWGYINDQSKHLLNGLFRPVKDDLIKVLDIDFRGSTTHIEIEEEILTRDLPVATMGFYGDELNCRALFSDQELQHMVLGADYVIVHEKEASHSFMGAIRGIFNANISQFEKLKSVESPWGSMSVYGKKTERAIEPVSPSDPNKGSM